VGEQGLLVFCAVLATPFLIPVSLPFASTVLGMPMLLIGMAVTLNRVPWLPDWLCERSLPSASVKSSLEHAVHMADRLELVQGVISRGRSTRRLITSRPDTGGFHRHNLRGIQTRGVQCPGDRLFERLAPAEASGHGHATDHSPDLIPVPPGVSQALTAARRQLRLTMPSASRRRALWVCCATSSDKDIASSRVAPWRGFPMQTTRSQSPTCAFTAAESAASDEFWPVSMATAPAVQIKRLRDPRRQRTGCKTARFVQQHRQPLDQQVAIRPRYVRLTSR
jgi:hypothetical protein